jgi:hypothetical protein
MLNFASILKKILCSIEIMLEEYIRKFYEHVATIYVKIQNKYFRRNFKILVINILKNLNLYLINLTYIKVV